MIALRLLQEFIGLSGAQQPVPVELRISPQRSFDEDTCLAFKCWIFSFHRLYDLQAGRLSAWGCRHSGSRVSVLVAAAGSGHPLVARSNAGPLVDAHMRPLFAHEKRVGIYAQTDLARFLFVELLRNDDPLPACCPAVRAPLCLSGFSSVDRAVTLIEWEDSGHEEQRRLARERGPCMRSTHQEVMRMLKWRANNRGWLSGRSENVLSPGVRRPGWWRDNGDQHGTA